MHAPILQKATKLQENSFRQCFDYVHMKIQEKNRVSFLQAVPTKKR